MNRPTIFTRYKNKFKHDFVISVLSEMTERFITEDKPSDGYDVDMYDYLPLVYRDLHYSVFSAYKKKILPIIESNRNIFLWKGKELPISEEIKTCKQLIPGIYAKLVSACKSQRGDSHLSEYIALGLFSTQLLFHLALKHNNLILLDQFMWRLFYYSASSLSDRILWTYNKSRHERFVNCSTGFEYVDAIMNCLKSTGYISNRQRMLVASFYCKILFLSWKEGRKIFEEYLSDYDEKLNNGNWLWASQIQFDNQIFVRHFKPDLQAKKYDSNRSFRIRWLPYLSDDPLISANQKTNKHKPKMIVDYNEARNFFNSRIRSV
jgi:hypothetical protein